MLPVRAAERAILPVLCRDPHWPCVPSRAEGPACAGGAAHAAQRGAGGEGVRRACSRHKFVATLRGYVRRADLFHEHAGAAFPLTGNMHAVHTENAR